MRKKIFKITGKNPMIASRGITYFPTGNSMYFQYPDVETIETDCRLVSVKNVSFTQNENVVLKMQYVLRFMDKQPGKAIISANDREPYTILIDKNFWSRLSIPERDFVLFHELAHRIRISYRTDEIKCDTIALNLCLKIGYNPSQLVNILSEIKDSKRRENLIKILKGFKV